MVCHVVPGPAAGIQDVVVGAEHGVGQPVLAKELPDVLDRVQFGAIRRQGKKGDVFRDLESPALFVPSGAVEDDDGVMAWLDLTADLLQVQPHHGAVDSGQDQSGTDVTLWADGAEDIGPFIAQVLGMVGNGRPDPVGKVFYAPQGLSGLGSGVEGAPTSAGNPIDAAGHRRYGAPMSP